MESIERRYDIDWLRVIAIGLLLIYHIAIVFQPWAALIGFMQNNKSLKWLWIPMSMLNVWRIPLLFFVSGMGVCFAMKKRDWKQLLIERSRRILLPLIFGIIIIVPIHFFLWQIYYSQDISYVISRSHLWFLGNIFAYVLILLPLFYYLKHSKNGQLNKLLNKVFKNPLGLLVVIIPFVIEAEVVSPKNFVLYAMTWHGFFLGLLAFLFGYIFIYCGTVFWPNILKWRLQYLLIAITLFFVRYFVFELQAPAYLIAIESNFWIFSILGLAYKHLNSPGKALTYLSKAAYPVYIIHMVFLYLGSIIILPLELSGVVKFILIVAFTGIGCMTTYELVIKRINFIRPLFGLTSSFKTKPNLKLNRMKRMKTFTIKRAILIITVLSLFSISCTLESSSQYAVQPPEDINDGLKIGSLDEVNIDTRLIEKALFNIKKGKYKEVHSMLIYKDNKLVLEEYFQGHKYQWDAPNHHAEFITWNRELLHDVKSVTKSITSACIGIAVENGFISSVHQSIFDYLPEHHHLNTSGKDAITIEHLLTMTSGLEWDEWGAPLSSSENDIIGLWFNCDDQIACILERPLVNEPGTSFTYSGGNIIVLGEIIRNATGMTIDDFSRQYLFNPLMIDSSNWSLQYENGVIESAGSLELTPRAMIKIGAAFLNKGVWNGKRIISEQWVKKSAIAYNRNKGINIPGQVSGKHGYSYTWWQTTFTVSGKKFDMYNAGGWGGQEIMVVPELNTVIVFTGGNYVSNVKVFKILEKYILPSIL